jgi:biotin-(acetyl-CoA carboxylase) ligase
VDEPLSVGADRIVNVLAALLPALRGVRAGGHRLDEAELAAYAARDWLRGRAIAEPLVGVAEGIDATGALLVRTPLGTTDRVRAGSVVLAAATGSTS